MRASSDGDSSMDAMRRHLDGACIGYRPGDATAGPPPAVMPSASTQPPPGIKTIDLRQMSMAELAAEAAATKTRDFFAALLPNPPGVPPGRLAYMTGQEPKQEAKQEPKQEEFGQQQQREQQGAAPQAAAPAAAAAEVAAQPLRAAASAKLSDEQIVVVLSRYLPARPQAGGSGGSAGGAAPAAGVGAGGGRRQAGIPWEELGLGKGGPRMGGVECDLRQLWRLAYADGGGWESMSSANKWAYVAQQLGADLKRITNAGYLVQQWYKRFLLPYEQHLQRRAGGSGKPTAAAAAEDAAMGDAGPAVA